MSDVQIGPDGRATIHHRETGQVLTCSVPTAIENVANSGGIWAHGAGDGKVTAKPAATPVPEQVIPLSEEDVLPLPQADPLDHDGDGRKGGSVPVDGDDERKQVIAALKASGVKFFAGAKTDVLKAKLAEARGNG